MREAGPSDYCTVSIAHVLFAHTIGSLPDRFLKALVKAIGGSNVTHFKVFR